MMESIQNFEYLYFYKPHYSRYANYYSFSVTTESNDDIYSHHYPL